MSQSDRPDTNTQAVEQETGTPGEASPTEISNDELSDAAGGIMDKKWILPYVDQV